MGQEEKGFAGKRNLGMNEEHGVSGFLINLDADVARIADDQKLREP